MRMIEDDQQLGKRGCIDGQVITMKTLACPGIGLVLIGLEPGRLYGCALRLEGADLLIGFWLTYAF